MVEMVSRIRAALKDKHMTQITLAARRGIAPQTFRNQLTRGDFYISTLESIADILDCDVVLRDRHTGKIY
ncbi:MAG: helix-turn-helix transcriptional regulator [Oscillospiraceae bacterium]|nr:helix-turn-helix transcriptional regulator [Oscillospiraceae bacterium]